MSRPNHHAGTRQPLVLQLPNVLLSTTVVWETSSKGNSNSEDSITTPNGSVIRGCLFDDMSGRDAEETPLGACLV